MFHGGSYDYHDDSKQLLDGGVYLKAFDLYQKNQSGKSRMFQNKNVLTFICRWCGVAVFKFFSHVVFS